MRQAVVLGLVLALVFGRDALSALGSGGAAPTLDADAGMSEGRVHIAFCTS